MKKKRRRGKQGGQRPPEQPPTREEIRRLSAEELEALVRELQAGHSELRSRVEQAESRVRGEVALRQRLEADLRLRSEITRNLAEGVCLVRSEDLTLLDANDRLHEMLGYGSGELVGRPIAPHLASPARERIEETAGPLRQAMRDRGSWSGEVRLVRRDGNEFWCRANASWLDDSEHGPLLIAALTDLTEWRQVESALKSSARRLRAIVSTAPDAVVTVHFDGTIESFNPAAEQVFGYRAEEVIGQSAGILIPSPYRENYDRRIAGDLVSRVRAAAGTTREVAGRRKDGTSFPLEAKLSVADELQLVIAIARDVSERKRLQEELLTIAEREQRRIGQDLHDDVGQELTGLRMGAETLADSLEREGAADAQAARRMVEGLNRTLDKVRALSRGLVPVEIGAEGLIEALQELTRLMDEAYAPSCTFQYDLPSLVPENRAATQIYRIAQEALTNALRHARAESIRVELRRNDALITLAVYDDGVGIDAQAWASPGMGLKIMQHRAGLIGAALDVRPRPEGGTQVLCTLRAPSEVDR